MSLSTEVEEEDVQSSDRTSTHLSELHGLEDVGEVSSIVHFGSQ